LCSGSNFYAIEESAQARACGVALAFPATDPPLAARSYPWEVPRPDPGCHFHPRKAAEIEDRAIPGHWEGDLLRGARNSQVATLVERDSRFTSQVKAPTKDTAAVVAALSRRVRKLPALLRRSLTWDRGLEMAQDKRFTIATNAKVYFCDPQSPWQRGTNENTNRLLRQCLPKKAVLSRYAQSDLDKIALRLNQRPRKMLGFETPGSRLRASVAMTHLRPPRFSEPYPV